MTTVYSRTLSAQAQNFIATIAGRLDTLRSRRGAMPAVAPMHLRWLCGLVGVAAVAVSCRLTLAHVTNGDFMSPIGSALVVFAGVTIAAAAATQSAWQSGRRLLAAILVTAAVTGESFGLTTAAERLLDQRSLAIRSAATANHEIALARERLELARAELLEATRRASEATRGGCREQCAALRANEQAARERAAHADRTLADLGPEVAAGSALARRIGADQATFDVVMAVMFGAALTLGGAALIAFASQERAVVPAVGASYTSATAAAAVASRDKPTETGLPSTSPMTERPLPADALPFAPTQEPASQLVNVGGHGLSARTASVLKLVADAGGSLQGSQRDLATQLGTSQSTLNRALREARAAGLAEVEADPTTGTTVRLLETA